MVTIDNVIACTIMPNDEVLLILGSNTGSCSQKQANSGSVTVEASLNVWSSTDSTDLLYVVCLFVVQLAYNLMKRRPSAGVRVLYIGSTLYEKRHHPILTIGGRHL